jgi:glycosyltransferase involved in cell wall biosynthesis
VTYKNNNFYAYLDNEVRGLKLKFIPKIKLGRYSLSALVYLFFNAKKIDVLHLFHHREKTYLNFLIYKWRNPNGIAFLKSDMGLNSIKEYEGLVPKKRPKYSVRQWLLNRVFPNLDVISVETEEGYDYLRRRYSAYQNKFLFMPNGLNLDRMYSLIPSRAFEKKENIILTVGRIGAPEKNNEMLLNAVSKMSLGDWKVVFIGGIEKEFEVVIEKFFQENQTLKEKIIFTGAIYDRKVLFDWYARSKIFCLTSIEESFGFVLIEAMAYANYVVTTAISSANEITNYEKNGSVVYTEDELRVRLSVLMQDDNILVIIGEKGYMRAQERYAWDKILQKLDGRIRIKE